MIKFRILKRSKKSLARLGVLETSHGEVETPSLVPVATQAVVKALWSEEAEKTGCQILIANTFHLHLKPGEKIIKAGGGLHKFMNWHRPMMTDSGGFQVFSLGFGRDSGVGKIFKYFSAKKGREIIQGQQPQFLKITDKGVYFRSPLDGSKIFLGPKESIGIQQQLGADIIFVFDECTSPLAQKDYIKKSLERTHNWAEVCLKEHKKAGLPATRQALFGIIQGSHFKDLRTESARFINSLNFDGFGIGGDLGKSKIDTLKILNWTISYLNEDKPRHLLGIGHPEDIEPIIKSGIDTFDCTAPTHYGRRGVAFTSQGKMDLNQSKFFYSPAGGGKPLDGHCDCFVCQNYKRNYLCHLVRAKEITGLSLLSFHNLHFFNSYVKKIREKIKRGTF